MASLLSRDTSWVVRAPNQRELFCIDYISSYLDSIHVVTRSFYWVSQCKNDENVVFSVLNIYTKYVIQSESQQMPVLEPNSAAMKLFMWISNVQKFLITWQEKFTKHLVNYDQIVNYKDHLKILLSMARLMKVEESVCSERTVKDLKHQYEREFKELNSLLLKPVPGDGNNKT